MVDVVAPIVLIDIEKETEGTPERVVVDFGRMPLSQFMGLVNILPGPRDNPEGLGTIELFKNAIYNYLGANFIDRPISYEHKVYIVPYGSSKPGYFAEHVADFIRNRLGLVPGEVTVRC